MYPTLDDLTALLGGDPVGRRFLEKLVVGPIPDHAPELGPCLLWTRALDGSGYSAFTGTNLQGGKQQLPGHVWLYQTLYGSRVPEGMELDHQCHDPDRCTVPGPKCPHRACVIHVLPKSIRDNRLRSNSVPGRNSRKTMCEGKYGPHDLTDPDNQYWVPTTGHLQCKGCRRARHKAGTKKARAQAGAG